jgi:hypothetical protein
MSPHLPIACVLLAAAACQDALPPATGDALRAATSFGKDPDPKGASRALAGLVQSGDLDSPFFRERPDRFLILAHGFGHIARRCPEVLRRAESLVEPNKDPVARRFLLAVLSVGADDTTRGKLEVWSREPGLEPVHAEIDDVRKALADGKVRLPRDRAASDPLELDLLWADYLATGEYAPIARILDVLDRPDALRAKIDAYLAKNPGEREALLASLADVGLTAMDDPKSISELDLDFLASRGMAAGGNPARAEALRRLGDRLGLGRDDWVAIAMKGTADWSSASNVRQHPELADLLRKHQNDRPPKSQAHLRLWLEQAQTGKPKP